MRRKKPKKSTQPKTSKSADTNHDKSKKWSNYFSIPLIVLIILSVIIIYDIIIPRGYLYFSTIELPEDFKKQGITENYFRNLIVLNIKSLNDSATEKINQMLTSEGRINDIDKNSIVNKEILSRKDDLLEDSKFEIGFGDVSFSYTNLVRFFRNKIGKKDTYIDVYVLKGDSTLSANISVEKYNSPLNIPKQVNVTAFNTSQIIKDVDRLSEKVSVAICEKYDPIITALYEYNFSQDYENTLAWKNRFYNSFSEREEFLTTFTASQSNYLSTWSLVLLGNMYEEKGVLFKSKDLLRKSLDNYYKAQHKEPSLKVSLEYNIKKVGKILNEFFPANEETDLISRILSKYENQISGTTQLIIVYNENIEENEGILLAYQKTDSIWNVFSMKTIVNIGSKGFAKENLKIEGDLKAPTGLFRITRTFGYHKDINTKMPFIELSKYHVWITDPNSIDYNKIKTVKPNTDKYEQMLRPDNLHKYGIVIEYNTEPVIKNKGSAITIHVQRRSRFGTAGCISLPENKIKDIIEWLDPNSKPIIIMGNILDLY